MEKSLKVMVRLASLRQQRAERKLRGLRSAFDIAKVSLEALDAGQRELAQRLTELEGANHPSRVVGKLGGSEPARMRAHLTWIDGEISRVSAERSLVSDQIEALEAGLRAQKGVAVKQREIGRALLIRQRVHVSIGRIIGEDNESEL